jgi:hypothetical protein
MILKIDPFMMALALLGDETLTENLLQEIISQLRSQKFGVTEEDIVLVQKKLENQIGVRGVRGVGITDPDQPPWLDERKKGVAWDYWIAYKTWIRKSGFGLDVVRVLDEDTDAILAECGDPKREGPWSIKGLVMGDVQSGKTANYSGLINKAADVGYNVIILLTGVIEELRAQTQGRLDEGFSGQDSVKKLQKISAPLGVGLFNTRKPAVLTSVEKDFLKANLEALGGIPLGTLVQSEPVLLVLKKNKFVLTALHDYLKDQLEDDNESINLSLFLIDDEADNASVNVKSDDTPAAINGLIRKIKNIFDKSTYCAYTATPFANVFIDPDNDDLFPDNFVYALNTPTSYVGAASIFLDEGAHGNHLEVIEDAEACFPEKHSKDLQINGIPSSMEEAIRCFLITTCIRDLRIELLKHRSMLVNVTRFTDVQSRLSEVVKNYLYRMKDEIRQYLAHDEIWSKHEELRILHETYITHFDSCDISWNQIRKELSNSIESVKVVTINQKSSDVERLNYHHYKDTTWGRRVIAIGGLTLSRGLTLEGLSTSYFYRNSKAYDTLLQMGRWFGYRTGYADLCRLWMTTEAQDWYSHLAGVVDELKRDLKAMHAGNRKPKDFGMRIKSYPGTLLVTALNKMKTAKEVAIRISFSKYKAETPFLYRSPDIQKKNLDRTLNFITSLGIPAEQKGRRLWSCSKEKLASFISSLDISPLNAAFMPSSNDAEHPLIEFIRGAQAANMQSWDIALPQGGEVPRNDIQIIDRTSTAQPFKPRGRQFEKVSSTANYLKLNRQRVGEIEDETIGMDPDEVLQIKKTWLSENPSKTTVPGKAFLESRSRPLLTIHLICPILPKENNSISSGSSKRARNESMSPSEVGFGPFVALGLSFPNLDDSTDPTVDNLVTYRLNKIALQELGLIDTDTDDEVD